MEQAYRILFLSAAICIGVAMLFSLIRSIRGPRITDRIVGINMIGTLALLCIVIVSRLLNEDWLLDVGLIYAMISFLAVLVLSILHIRSRSKKKEDDSDA